MLSSALLVGCVVLGGADTPAGDDLKSEVYRLFYRLNAPSVADRDAAQRRLLELGPKVLDLLPPVTSRTPGEIRKRAGEIRRKLQRTAAEATARASLISLRADAMPPSKVLAALQEQSGNKILLRQRVPDAALKIDFQKVPFWQALDQVLDRAGLTVYPYGDERAIHVVPRGESRSNRTERAVYTGPFRIEPALIVAQRDLTDPDGESLRLMVQVAWEPRLQLITLKQKLSELSAVDENGNSLALPNTDVELEVPSTDAASTQLLLPLKLPPRNVKEIARLKGRLLATIAGKVETFTFDKLANRVEKGAKDDPQRIAGVVVTLERVFKNNEVWTVRVRVRYDDPGESLQSHQMWIYDNPAYLQAPDGEVIEGGSETVGQNDHGVGIEYHFVLDGDLAGHKFIYKTPGVIVTTGFDYEIKGVKLP